MKHYRTIKYFTGILVIGAIVGMAYVASGQNEKASRVRVLGPANQENVNLPALFSQFGGDNEESPLAHLRNWIETISDRIGAFIALREELQLTDEQVQELLALRGYCREEMKIVLQDRKELINQVLDPEPKEIAIRLTATELGKAIGDAAVKASELAQEIRTILTPEQLTRLREFIESRPDWSQVLENSGKN